MDAALETPASAGGGGWRMDRENYGALSAMCSADPFAAILAGDFELPKELDPRGWSPIRYQGQEGSCQGHAETAVGEGCYHVATGTFRQFSPDAAYYWTQEHDGLLGSDQGSTIGGGLWVGGNIGHLPEEMMPYSDAYNPQSIPAGAKAEAAKFKIKNRMMFDQNSWEAMIKFMGLGLGFVEIGISWALRLGADGKTISWSPGAGGHALAIMGYGNEWSGGFPEWVWLKNSHGKKYGLNGWAKLTRTIWQQMTANRWTVCGGLSDMATDDIQVRKPDWKAW